MGVVLGLFIVRGVLWVPGVNRAGVHPALLAIKEPLRSATSYSYFDGGSVGLELVDASGKAFAFSLPVERPGEFPSYPVLVAGVRAYTLPGGEKHPCSEDSRKFIAMLIDIYAERGVDRQFCLQRLRNAPLDVVRRWWFIKTYRE